MIAATEGITAATSMEAPRSPEIQVNEVALAIRGLLKALGEDPDREGLRDTPSRVARMYQELLAGVQEDPADHLELGALMAELKAAYPWLPGKPTWATVE